MTTWQEEMELTQERWEEQNKPKEVKIVCTEPGMNYDIIVNGEVVGAIFKYWTTLRKNSFGWFVKVDFENDIMLEDGLTVPFREAKQLVRDYFKTA